MPDDDYLEKQKDLEKLNEELLDELRRIKRKPEGQIAYLFLILGITFLGLSIVHNHTILALAGTALTFWGALLLYVKPTSFIRKEIIDISIVGYVDNIQNLVDKLEFNGTPKYVSPGTLKSLRKVFLYYPKSDSEKLPSDETLSDVRFFFTDPPAIKLIPPGHDLFLQIEKELRINFSSVDLEYIKTNLRKAIVDGLEIAKSIDLEIQESMVEVTINESIFDKVVKRLSKRAPYPIIGDPLTSAIACIIASSTRHPTVVKSVTIDTEKNEINATYEIIKREQST